MRGIHRAQLPRALTASDAAPLGLWPPRALPHKGTAHIGHRPPGTLLPKDTAPQGQGLCLPKASVSAGAWRKV